MNTEDPWWAEYEAQNKALSLTIKLLLNAPSKKRMERAHAYLLEYRCRGCERVFLQVLKTPPYRSIVIWEDPIALRKMGYEWRSRSGGWRFYPIPEDAELPNSEYRTHRALPHLPPSSETRFVTATCHCNTWRLPEVSILNDLADKRAKRHFTPPPPEPVFE